MCLKIDKKETELLRTKSGNITVYKMVYLKNGRLNVINMVFIFILIKMTL